MSVEIDLKIIPKVDIHIPIHPVPIHPPPVMKKGLTAARSPENGTEKRQKICDTVICLCHGSKERLICRE